MNFVMTIPSPSSKEKKKKKDIIIFLCHVDVKTLNKKHKKKKRNIKIDLDITSFKSVLGLSPPPMLRFGSVIKLYVLYFIMTNWKNNQC